MYSPNDPADHISIEAHENKMKFYHQRDAEQRQIIDEQVEENRGLRADVLLMQKANAEQRDLIARLQLEAQAHAQEARTANATIAEIYQVVSGGTGEPGNWHGAEPVRRVIQERREEITRLQTALKAVMNCIDVDNLTTQTVYRQAEQSLTQEPPREKQVIKAVIDLGYTD